MRRTIKRYRKVNTIAIFLFGLLCMVGSVICLATSIYEGARHDRWQAAAELKEVGELERVGVGGDVTIVGSVAPWTPAAQEGLALYESWERELDYDGDEERETWNRVFVYKPDFELLFGGHSITIQGERAALQRTRELYQGVDFKLTGFAPGDEVTVMGTVDSLDGGSAVRANIVCGDKRETCLGQMGLMSKIAAVAAAFLALGGVGLGVWGVRRLRA